MGSFLRIQGEAGACGCEEGPPGKHREWLTGASGSGKTTLLRAVEAMEIPAVA
jgi:ABC-type molybdate transport system ATPase subunit